jgi:glycosyltransferase involved in cell wall biosynthesis
VNTIFKGSIREFIEGCDMIIAKHMDNPQAISDILSACAEFKIPLVVDLDDNVWDIREDQPAHQRGLAKGDEKRAFMLSFISCADAIFCSTNHLEKIVKARLKDVFNVDMPTFVLPNCFYPDEWVTHTSKGSRQGVTIGWHGSITHNADIKMVLPALVAIVRHYKDVKVELVGGLNAKDTMELFKDVPYELQKKFIIRGGTPSWKGFPYLIMKQRWDIGIAPLIDDVFNKSKSHIKWMEFAMKKIPVIASNLEPYNDLYDKTPLIEHGKTGYLCNTTEEWVDTLAMLIEDKKLREKIGTNGFNAVMKNWTYKKNIKKWDKAIKSVLKLKK